MRILIADDQSRVRFALRVLLEQQPNWSVVGEAARADELLERVGALAPDLLLLDWELPGKGMLEVIPAIRQVYPGVQVIFLSDSPEMIPAAVAVHADDFASKTNPPDQLLSAIQGCESRR